MTKFEAINQNENIQEILSYIQAWLMALPPPNGLSKYEPRPSDVIITSFPKAGTTLMQQMTYQVLVASGHAPHNDPKGEAFSDISDIAPWINFSPEIAEGLETNPRLYKSHSTAKTFHIGSQRHIVVLRDPANFPASWLDFMADMYPDDVAQRMYDLGRPLFDAIFKQHILAIPALPNTGSPLPMVDLRWFHFAADWLEYAHRDDVLILFYEDMVGDPATTANMVAAFLDVHLPEDALSTIIHRCSRDYMVEGTRFKSVWDARILNCPPLVTKVQKDRPRTFARFSLTDDQKAAVSAEMKKTFPVDSYDQLKLKVSEKQRKKLGITN